MSEDWSELSQDAGLVAELEKAKKERDKIARQLHDVKHRQADYLATVREAVEDSVTRIRIAPVRQKLVTPPKDGHEEYAVALLSDMQTGKITPDYNSGVARERVMLYADKVIELATVQERDHPVRHCIVPMLGDMVEGVDIFPGQQWLIDSTLYDQVFNTTPVICVDFIRKLLTHFDTVTVHAVDGNHGRIGRKGQYGPMDNADRMVYRIIELMLKDEPRFKLVMTDPDGERNWFQIMEIGTYSALLIHGDQIRGSMGFPWYGLGKKVNSWAAGGLGRDTTFQDVFMGHYHQLSLIPLNHRNVYANGSTESYNTFAQETLAAQSEPSQWLLFVDPVKGRVTASYGVHLR